MRMSRTLLSFVAVAMLAVTGAMAASGTSGKLRLYETVTVQGKQLPPGNYKVEWSGSGSDVQVSILNGKETVATVPAKVAPTAKNSTDGYSATKQADGSSDLTTIFFHGTSFELRVEPQSANNAQQPAPTGSN